jgi:hypothetical protein
MFQRTITRVCCIGSGNEHNPKALSQLVLVPAHNFSQTAPNTIANNCASDATRGNKAYAARARILYWHHIGY